MRPRLASSLAHGSPGPAAAPTRAPTSPPRRVGPDTLHAADALGTFPVDTPNQEHHVRFDQPTGPPTDVHAVTSEFGARLQQAAATESACDRQLTIYRWTLSVSPSDIPALARDVGRVYITEAARLLFPNAEVRDAVPTADTVRKGDLGEIVAMGIYSTRMGRTVPYTKLQLAKNVANATAQGPDTVCLTITQGEDLEPVSVEAKCRPIGRPSNVLAPIEESSKVVTSDYLAQAWASGVQLMLGHPDHARHFAFSAAQHLGRLIDPKAPLPPHLRHGVAVVGEDRLSTQQIEDRWQGAPHVTELHVVTVPDLVNTMNRIFDAAAALTYQDLTGGAAPLIAPRAKPGISGLVSRDMPAQLADTSIPDPLRDILEASLWYLADEDGLARARASALTDHDDLDVCGLAQLLTGALWATSRSRCATSSTSKSSPTGCVRSLKPRPSNWASCMLRSTSRPRSSTASTATPRP